MTQSSSRSSSLRGATTTTKQASVVSDSTRSWKSWTSDGAPGSTSAHSNLMRTHAKRDPMTVYEVVKLLGEGSMVSHWKKDKIAGAFVGDLPCFSFFGNTFLFCVPCAFFRSIYLLFHIDLLTFFTFRSGIGCQSQKARRCSRRFRPQSVCRQSFPSWTSRLLLSSIVFHKDATALVQI